MEENPVVAENVRFIMAANVRMRGELARLRERMKRRPWWIRLLRYLVVSWQKWRRAVALARYAALSPKEQEAAEDAALSRNLLILRGSAGSRGQATVRATRTAAGAASCRPCAEGPEERESDFLRELVGMPPVVPEDKSELDVLFPHFATPDRATNEKGAAHFGTNVTPLVWKKTLPEEEKEES